MNRRDAVTNKVKEAAQRASAHVAGNRDTTLPDYMDAQVGRFLDTLNEMQAALQSPSEDRVIKKYMCMAIADGWPFESELGKLICEAEDGYHSLQSTS